jgi:hypothetical protein
LCSDRAAPGCADVSLRALPSDMCREVSIRAVFMPKIKACHTKSSPGWCSPPDPRPSPVCFVQRATAPAPSQLPSSTRTPRTANGRSRTPAHHRRPRALWSAGSSGADGQHGDRQLSLHGAETICRRPAAIAVRRLRRAAHAGRRRREGQARTYKTYPRNVRKDGSAPAEKRPIRASRGGREVVAQPSVDCDERRGRRGRRSVALAAA